MKCASEPCGASFTVHATTDGVPHCPTCKCIFFFREDGTLAGPAVSTMICPVCGSTINADAKQVYVERKLPAELHECKGGPYQGPSFQVGGTPPGPVLADPVPVPKDAAPKCRRGIRVVQGQRLPSCLAVLPFPREKPEEAFPAGKLVAARCAECGLMHGFVKLLHSGEMMYGAIL